MSEADLLWRIQGGFQRSPEADVLDILKAVSPPDFRTGVIAALVCVCELRKYDLNWLSSQFTREDLGLDEAMKQLVLEKIYASTCEAEKPFFWEPFAGVVRQLELRYENDRFAINEVVEGVRIVSRIGSGGLAVVYGGVSLADDSRVAIKAPLAFRRAGPDSRAEVLRAEFRLMEHLGQFAISGVPKQYYWCETDRGPISVNEFIDGASLAEFMHQAECDLNTCLRIVADLSDTLDHLHRTGHIHSDIKPENVLVDKERRVHLVDFNVSLRDDPTAIKDGRRSGTIGVMSPESTLGVAADLDIRQDVYSLGVTLYELVCKRPLNQAREREEAVVISVLLGSVHKPHDPQMPPAVEAIVGNCIGRHLDDRFEIARDVAAACRQAIAMPDVEFTPTRIPPLIAWRLGRTIALIRPRIKVIQSSLSIMASGQKDASLKQQINDGLDAAATVAEHISGCVRLASQLAAPIPPCEQEQTIMKIVYRRGRITPEQEAPFQAALAAAEQWVKETFQRIDAGLSSRPEVLAWFELGVVTEQAKYSQQARQAWPEYAEAANLPEAMLEGCRTAVGDPTIEWKDVAESLDQEIKRWMRWKAVCDEPRPGA